jgi:hypothetical protein
MIRAIFIVIVFITLLCALELNSQTIKPYSVHRVDDHFIGKPVGSHNPMDYTGKVINVSKDRLGKFSLTSSSSDFYVSVNFSPTGGTSIFDQQSNACPMQLWQDPVNPQFLHAVYMESPMSDTYPVFPFRRTRYYFSSNYGSTWELRSELPNNIKSGYGTVTGFSDGSIAIANHYVNGPNIPRTFIHIESFPQLGSFTTIDPGLGATSQVEWPRIIATDNINSNVKFVMLSAGNESDSSFYNYCTGITPSSFGQWKFFRARHDECYSIARSESGKIGIAFVNNDVRFPTDIGDVFFMESSDQGITFSNALKIFDADLTSPNADSMGAFRGISIVYSNDQPRVVFESVFQQYGVGFFPAIASKIMYWSPSLPGNDPHKSKIIVDSLDVPYHPHQGVNDLLTGICRPVIGKSDDGAVLFVAFMVADSLLAGSFEPTSFNNVFLTASADGGTSWKSPVIVNSITPRRDWGYISISPTNDQNSSKYFVNLLMQADNIPGSYVNGQANGKSLAQQMFARVEIEKPLFVSQVSGNIPTEFHLYQNYPNPFNPETTIRFSIPETSETSLIVYDVNGRMIKILFSNRIFAPGTYDYNLNLIEYSSGIYYYSFISNGAIQTNKMVLLK